MDWALTDMAEGLGFAGLLGVGPKMLPSMLLIAWDYNDGTTDTAKHSCIYTLNDDGTIATEKIGNHTYTYVYATAATRAADEVATPISTEKLREIMRSKREARRARHHHND